MQIHGGRGAQRQRANPLGVEVIVVVIVVAVAAQDPVLKSCFHPCRIPRLLVKQTHHVDLCPGGPLDIRVLIAGVYGGFPRQQVRRPRTDHSDSK